MVTRDVLIGLYNEGNKRKNAAIYIECEDALLVAKAIRKLSVSNTWCVQTKFDEVRVVEKTNCESTVVLSTNEIVNKSWSKFFGGVRVNALDFDEFVTSLSREIRRLIFLNRLAECAGLRLFNYFLEKRRAKIEYVARRFELDVAIELCLDKELVSEIASFFWVFPNHLICHSQRAWVYSMRRFAVTSKEDEDQSQACP